MGSGFACIMCQQIASPGTSVYSVILYLQLCAELFMPMWLQHIFMTLCILIWGAPCVLERGGGTAPWGQPCWHPCGHVSQISFSLRSWGCESVGGTRVVSGPSCFRKNHCAILEKKLAVMTKQCSLLMVYLLITRWSDVDGPFYASS